MALQKYLQPVNKEIDFGTCRVGDTIRRSFQFISTASVPVYITDARGSCGCTTASYTNKTLKNGDAATIFVVFSADEKQKGFARKSVVVATSIGEYCVFYLKGQVQ